MARRASSPIPAATVESAQEVLLARRLCLKPRLAVTPTGAAPPRLLAYPLNRRGAFAFPPMDIAVLALPAVPASVCGPPAGSASSLGRLPLRLRADAPFAPGRLKPRGNISAASATNRTLARGPARFVECFLSPPLPSLSNELATFLWLTPAPMGKMRSLFTFRKRGVSQPPSARHRPGVTSFRRSRQLALHVPVKRQPPPQTSCRRLIQQPNDRADLCRCAQHCRTDRPSNESIRAGQTNLGLPKQPGTLRRRRGRIFVERTPSCVAIARDRSATAERFPAAPPNRRIRID
jgi:hypothetical protein